MPLVSPLWWFAVCALTLAVAAVIAARSVFYRERLAEQSLARYEAIDGLRGFLALGVLGDHAVDMYTWRTGVGWGRVESFYEHAGIAGVSLFFAITGYLFWLRVLRAGERFDARAFYVSRLRRLVPMYAASVLALVAVAFWVSGPVLNESVGALAREVRDWASFGFLEGGALNGVREAHYINAVYWTLAYEWSFYLALPFLALFARGRGILLVAAAVLAFGRQAPVVYNFLSGALAAMLVHGRVLEGRKLDSPWLAPAALAVLAAWFVAYPSPLVRATLLFVFFVLVAHGQTLFGLLRSRPAKMLGMVSYSYYLVHCIVLFVVVRVVDLSVPLRELGMLQYWLVVALAACATVVLSAFTFMRIEYPFIRPRAQPADGSAPPASILGVPWKTPLTRS